MKFLPNILKAFLINLCFIGIIFASETCPSISPKNAGDSTSRAGGGQLANDVVCSFIELQSGNNGTLASTSTLQKRKLFLT